MAASKRHPIDAVSGRFPNPAYRRKLVWGIRRKATASIADWDLFVRAVRERPWLAHVTPVLGGSGETPQYTEPLLSLLREIGRSLRRPPARRAGERRHRGE